MTNSLNETPNANRNYIGFFGCRNAGKSSVVNAVTGQDLSVVSDMKGTTTDPVYKAMELLPMGPVTIIDTPGMDDEGALGALRVSKAKQVLNKTDIAVLVVDATMKKTDIDEEMIRLFINKKIPYIIVYNKSDLIDSDPEPEPEYNEIYVSAKKGENIWELKEKIASIAITEAPDKKIVSDLVEPSDIIILVTPVDSAAPKGRLILPQQQVIRDILDAGGISIVIQEDKLTETLNSLSKKPKMVITDSQAFAVVSKDTPDDIFLTSFSILFARYKGSLEESVRGATAIEKLQDGDTVLVCEGCTHHRQCDDIGTVKLPRWIKEYTGKKLNFEFTSGGEFLDDLSKYTMIVHCGACMLNEREVKYRYKCSADGKIHITNYGILIAYMNGILKRSVEVFKDMAELLENK